MRPKEEVWKDIVKELYEKHFRGISVIDQLWFMSYIIQDFNNQSPTKQFIEVMKKHNENRLY